MGITAKGTALNERARTGLRVLGFKDCGLGSRCRIRGSRIGVQGLGFKVLRINHCGFGLRGLLIYDILI